MKKQQFLVRGSTARSAQPLIHMSMLDFHLRAKLRAEAFEPLATTCAITALCFGLVHCSAAPERVGCKAAPQ